ncbi:MAG: RagB/SusD family nutrient uptake outer membrane protein [Rikenellaceae bacterium]|nr:RagB/SusD family nutrient uptake outer membrane protein [Rikenellaceae bacterium]
MKKILFLVLGCSLLLTPSCKDFLQKNDPTNPTENTFWQSKNDFDMALTAIYARIRGGSYYSQTAYPSENLLSTFLAFFDNFSDNAVSNSVTMDGSEAVLQDVINPSNMPGMTGNAYGYAYACIERINIFLGKLDEFYSDKSNADYKQFKGEALALRGIMYHYLYVCYGEVPVVKEALTIETMYKEKASREDVYKAVVADFTDAMACLTPGEAYSARPGRITHDAVIAFRARTKLYHAYDASGKAVPAEMAEILTELNQIKAAYSMAPDILTNFHTGAQANSPEIMFSLRFLKPSYRNQIDLFVGDWKTICPTRDLVYAFPMADGVTKYTPDPAVEAAMYPDMEAQGKEMDALREQLKKQGLKDEEIEKKVAEELKKRAEALYDVYEKIFENRDPRLVKSIAHNNVYDFSAYIKSGADSVANGESSLTYFNVFKLVTPIANKESWNNGYTWEGDQDVVLMRWGHVLLMKAEAAFESGNTADAIKYINELRTPRGIVAITDLDQEALRNEIRIETCFEGLRYFDMKRWRILDKMNGKIHDPSMPSSFKVVVNPAHFDWPLPQSEILKARENGVDLKQNPGYL